jgi:mRNA interferase MazF
MIDKVTTTRRSSIHARLGALSAADLVRIERSLLVFLGIGGLSCAGCRSG